MADLYSNSHWKTINYKKTLLVGKSEKDETKWVAKLNK